MFGIAHTAVKPPAAAARVPGRDRLLVLAPGLAQVRVQVDEAGADDEALGVDRPGAARGAGPAPTSLDDAVLEQHVELRVDPLRRVDDAPALEQEPAHEAASALPPSSR